MTIWQFGLLLGLGCVALSLIAQLIDWASKLLHLFF